MQAHIVKSGTSTRFAASEASARQARTDMMTTLELKKSAVTISPVEVPTAKAELIEFMNGILKTAESQRS